MSHPRENRPSTNRAVSGPGASFSRQSAGPAFRGGKDDKRKPFSKPGGSSGAGGPSSFSKQGGHHKKRTPDQQSTQSVSAASTTADMFVEDESNGTKLAKAKKPKMPKPPVDPNEHISQRAFIGGLAKDVTPTDVEGRFKSFGQLKDVYLAKDVEGNCRGFGYVTLDTTRKDWSKCLALFNGAKWKGHVLKIEEANKDWQTRRQEDLEKQAKLEKKEQDALLKKAKRNPAKHAEDMSLITDKSMDGKRGWKRGRYGRPVITMKLDKMTYDPSHYKNNVEKLFNTPGKPLPLDQLPYQIDENEPVPKGKHLPTEVALAPFFSKTKSSIIPTNVDHAKSSTDGKKQTVLAEKEVSVTSKPESQSSQPHDKFSASDDRAMMVSILAGIDMSPRALSLDGSDFEDDEENGYLEEFGALDDTKADDLFADVILDEPAKVLSKSQRDSRPEDLFGDDDEDETEVNRPSLEFLEEEEDEDEDDEEMESAGEDEDDEDGEEDENENEENSDNEDDELDEDTIKAIAQLQESSSVSAGGLFDSDDDQDTTAADSAAKFAEESNAARLKALEAREAELEAARGKQQQLIASTLANIDSRDKKAGHVVFSDSDDYDSEDYDKMEEDHAKKLARLNKPPKSIFDSDSGSDEEGEEGIVTPRGKRKGVKEMFASEDEDDENEAGIGKFGEPDLNIKEQFEGPGGKALFKMQTKIGTGDSRFQLTKDFLDDRIREEDDVDFVAHQDRMKSDEYAEGRAGAADIILDEDRQAESNVSAEKMQAMNVLRAMFGDSVVRSKKKEEDTARKAKGGVGFTAGLTVRYDPDAAPPPPSLPAEVSQESKSLFDSESDSEPASVSEQDESNDEEDSKNDSEMEEEQKEDGESEAAESRLSVKKSVGFSFFFDKDTLNADEDEQNDKNSTSPTATNADTTRKFQVATDLKSLFAPAAGSFKMFGGDDESEDEDKDRNVEDERLDGSMIEDNRQDEDTIMTSYTDGSRTIFTSGTEALNRAPLSHSGSMFFFHFKNPALLKRSNFKTTNKVFMRTTTMDEVTAHWEKTRHAMTQEFKRKHKSASRNRARASKRFKTGAGSGTHGGSGLGDQS
ncbi:nucleolar protein 8 [Mortierella sp. GBA30]|nr:nucleolar protein 8 [Mortierella sp. GBA30]